MTIFVLSILSSILYRAGGLSKSQPYWIPIFLRKSFVRDYFCPILCLLPPCINDPHWVYLIVYFLMVGGFSTYWDRLFGYDNFAFAGFMLGIAALPLMYVGFPLSHLIVRALVIGLLWWIITHFFSNDHIEEHGRGFFVCIATYFLT